MEQDCTTIKILAIVGASYILLHIVLIFVMPKFKKNKK
jgi:uncharacterized membrane protein